MLKLLVPLPEKFDDNSEEFVEEYFPVEMEHSLASLFKWESKWEKSLISSEDTTPEQTFDYVRCMTLTPDVPEEIFQTIAESSKLSAEIENYIEAKMTASWFNDSPSNKKEKAPAITAEVIYYQMFSLNIPLEFEKRHLNHLLALIRVFSVKNEPEKKRTRAEIAADAAEFRRVNEERRKKYSSEKG